jgi:hypothetical protein
MLIVGKLLVVILVFAHQHQWLSDGMRRGYCLCGIKFNDVTKSYKREQFIKHCMDSKVMLRKFGFR